MTPDPSFVKDLQAYDKLLRCRYGKFTEKFIIERKMPIHHPQLRGEAPTSTRSARMKDLSIGYSEGFVHVLSVDPALLTWHHVAPALREADLHFAGTWENFNRKLDAEAEAAEAKQDKAQSAWAYETSLDAHERIQYLEGRRVALYDPEPQFEQREGYLVRDRRVRL
jgi:hypothetical protein